MTQLNSKKGKVKREKGAPKKEKVKGAKVKSIGVKKVQSPKEKVKKAVKIPVEGAAKPTVSPQPKINTAADVFVVKKAFSTNPNAVLYKIRTFVGWSAMVALMFAGLSILSDYSSPEDINNLAKTTAQTSVLGAAPKVPTPNEFSTAPNLTLTEKQDVTLTAVGDIMLARFVEKKMKTLNDFSYPFAHAKEFVKASDLTFGNLESPFFPGLTTANESTTFRADPRSVEGLTAAGFDVLSLANNHVMNYQVAGLNTTLETLKNANIAQVGAGQNKEESHRATIVDVKGQKVAFLAYVDQNIAPKNNHGVATDVKAGIAAMDAELMKQDVAAAKAQGADVVIVSMHAGIEYRKEPTQTQKDFAHAAIDAGASVVIGHHPHVVESVERYGNGIIMYSLGNFVFDQLFSDDVKNGLLARIILRADGSVGAEFFPTVNDKLQARVLEGQERTDALAKMGVPANL